MDVQLLCHCVYKGGSGSINTPAPVLYSVYPDHEYLFHLNTFVCGDDY